MKISILAAVSFLAAGVCLIAPVTAQSPASQSRSTKQPASKETAESKSPSDRDIADAKSHGKVWANTTSKVYHKDGQFYGKTKRGKFMSEDEARKAGYKEAKEPKGKSPENK